MAEDEAFLQAPSALFPGLRVTCMSPSRVKGRSAGLQVDRRHSEKLRDVECGEIDLPQFQDFRLALPRLSPFKTRVCNWSASRALQLARGLLVVRKKRLFIKSKLMTTWSLY